MEVEGFDDAAFAVADVEVAAVGLHDDAIADRVWRTRSQLELAIVEWAGWFNHARLHSALDDRPPAEFERTELAGHQLSFNDAILI